MKNVKVPRVTFLFDLELMLLVIHFIMMPNIYKLVTNQLN